jgi:hypothetical protein
MRPCLRLNAYLIGLDLHGRHITCRMEPGSGTVYDDCRGVIPVPLMLSHSDRISNFEQHSRKHVNMRLYSLFGESSE